MMPMAKKQVELVVARHEEDLAWLGNTSPDLKITVYNKGPDAPSPRAMAVVNLPNTGREAHSYLQHLVQRYETLSPLTLFCQGKPFDHAPDLHRILRELCAGQKTVADFLWLGFLIDTDDKRGRRLFVPWSKNPSGRELPLDECFRKIFGTESPEQFRFFGGAQFVVTAECVRSRPKSFYEKVLQVVLEEELAPHALERIWDRMFGVIGVSEDMMQGRETVYLKPIRRLAEDK